MTTCLIGIAGVWLLCDGVIGIGDCVIAVDKTGMRIRGWRYTIGIRLIRIAIGIALMVLACP